MRTWLVGPAPRAVGRALALVATLVTTLAVLGTSGPASSADEGSGDGAGTIVGSDGRTYPAAPPVVTGRGGELFWGPTFDQYCADGDGTFARELGRLARLVRVIRRSGREVVFTVAPDKTHVMADDLVRSELPHGRCDRVGIRGHRRALDEHATPGYVPLRRALAEHPRQTYWRTDPHWTTMGGGVFVREIAEALDPQVAARLRQRPGRPHTRTWPMAAQLGLPPETVRTVQPAGPVRVRETRGHLVPQMTRLVLDHSWRAGPASHTWGGDTLVLGDSFTFLSLRLLRPALGRGRWLWVGPANADKMPRAIARSDTVVLEVAEFLLPSSLLTDPDFRREVERALADPRREAPRSPQRARR